jgi:hypothetical protein
MQHPEIFLTFFYKKQFDGSMVDGSMYAITQDNQ